MSLQELPEQIAWLAVILPLLAGIYGGWTMLYAPERKLPDARRALGCSLALGLISGGGLALLGWWAFRGMLPGPMDPGEVLVPAAGISLLFFLAALGGSAFLARRGDGTAALLGVVLGPLLLIVVPVVAASLLGRAIGL